MGDRGHNRHGPKRGGCCAPFAESWDPVYTMCSMAWAEVYFRMKWRLYPSSRLAAIDMGQKLGGVVMPFSGGSWVHIEHKVPWAEAYLHANWHLSPSSRLVTTDIGRN